MSTSKQATGVWFASLLRPTDAALAPATRSRVQLHRLLSLLGAFLAVLYGALYDVASPDAVDPMGVRLGIAGLFVGLFAASYKWAYVRRRYVLWMRGLVYVVMAWFAVITALNRFAGDYAVGLLLLYAILGIVVGVGAEMIGTVLRFLGFGLLAAIGGVALGPASVSASLITLAGLATVAVVEGIVMRAYLTTRRRLREREGRLRAITENVSEGIYRSVPGEGLIYANPAFAEMFGYDSVEAVLETDPAALYAEPAERERLRRIAREKGAFDGVEIEFRRRDGTTFTGLVSGTVIRGGDGDVEHYDGAIANITDRKEAERKVREREARLRGLANSIPGVVFQFYARPDGTVGHYFVGEHAESVLGIPPEPLETFHDRALQHVPEEAREALTDSIEKAVANEAPWRIEIPFRTPAGEHIWLLGTSTPERRDGEVVFNGVLLDITERKEGQERWRALVESHPGGVLISADGRYQYANETAADILGADSPDVLIGQPIAERIVDGEEQVRERWRQIRQGRRTEPWEHEIVRLDGERRTVVAQSIPITYEGRRAAQTVLRDVTERRQREEALVEAKERAEEANRLKSAFLANMSHEIRTPLTSIIGFAEAIGDEVEPGTGDGVVPRFARLIRQSGRSLLETLDGLLNLSKLEAGELSTHPVDLCRKAEAVTEQFRPKAEAAGIDLRLTHDTPPVRARADEGGVRIVLRNLVSNALKYTDEGGRVQVRARREGTHAVLEVEDTGAGMEASNLPTLFEPFRQGAEGKTREYESTGLGLAVTKQAVDQMDGAIEVDTEKGEGTRITVRLPRPRRTGA